jgi:hypothetical protein
MVDGRKVPQFLFRPDEEQLAFAGLYELWPDPERAEDDPDRWVWSYTITTRSAPDAVGHIHDRRFSGAERRTAEPVLVFVQLISLADSITVGEVSQVLGSRACASRAILGCVRIPRCRTACPGS